MTKSVAPAEAGAAAITAPHRAAPASAGATLKHRDATEADLPAIVRLLAEDQIGGRKDDPSEPLNPTYRAAFDAIDRDPNQRLIVSELDGAVVGTMQLTLLPGLLNRGAWRRQIEGVRVAGDKRSLGLGGQMIDWALGWFREHDCFLAQLTSNNDRTGAHAFYQKLGWEKSHAGFKIYLTETH